MKKTKTLFLICFITIIVLFMISVAVLAGGTYEPISGYVYSTGHFNAGQSVVLSCTSMVDEYDGAYDVYLESFIYDGLPLNVMPYGGSLYLRSYTYSQPMIAVGNIASFSSAGYGYSYNYYQGYGDLGELISLVASSNVNLGCTVTVRWHA